MPTTTLTDRSPDAAAPARDLTIDLLRAVAIAAVAVGHWLVVVPSYEDGRFDGVNALATVPLMRPLTWLFQVMPLFFVVGGVANAASWRAAQARGETGPAWLRTRLERLTRPAALLVGAWAGLAAALRAGGVPAEVVEPIAWLVVVPVWFLAVYVIVVAVAPVMWRVHLRHGARAPVALALAAAAVDALRLAGAPEAVAAINFLLVFGACQQLGFAWYDGRLRRHRSAGVALLVGGAGALWLLTHVGPYPVSLVGYPGPEIANNAPPTVTLVALGLAQTGLALVGRPLLQRALAHRPVQAFALLANRHAMTILLWHFTALVAVSVVALPLGLVPTHPDGSAAWWATRLVVTGALALALVPIVALAGRLERSPGPRHTTGGRPPSATASAAPVLAVPVLAAAFAAITVGGLSGDGPLGLPLVALALFATGTALVRRPPRPERA